MPVTMTKGRLDHKPDQKPMPRTLLQADPGIQLGTLDDTGDLSKAEKQVNSVFGYAAF